MIKRLPLPSVILLLLSGLLVAASVLLLSPPSLVAADPSADVYFHTPGVPDGPSAPTANENHYPQVGSLDSRLLMWFIIQQHTYFGGFVLALPIFCVLLEFLGLVARNPAMAVRYDGLAQDLLKVALLALSVTAAVGSVMLTMFITLYPSFMQYMGGTFKVMMPLYALVFVGTTFLTIAYYYSSAGRGSASYGVDTVPRRIAMTGKLAANSTTRRKITLNRVSSMPIQTT